MPATLAFEGDLLVARFIGIFTSDDLLEAGRQVGQVELNEPRTPHRLIDVSEAQELRLSFESMHEFSLMRAHSKLKNSTRSAIFAPSQVQFGFARMYQSINENPRLEVAVFRDRAAAVAWLRTGA